MDWGSKGKGANAYRVSRGSPTFLSDVKKRGLLVWEAGGLGEEGEGMLRRLFVPGFINLTGEYVWVGGGWEALDRYFGGFFSSIFQFGIVVCSLPPSHFEY